MKYFNISSQNKIYQNQAAKSTNVKIYIKVKWKTRGEIEKKEKTKTTKQKI